MKLLDNLHFLYKKIRKFFKKEQVPFVYVALGDSTVEGIGASRPDRSFAYIISAFLKQSKGNVVFHNLGKSGATISDVVATQLEKTIAFQPHLITISVGANDIRHKTKTQDFIKDLNFLLQTLAEKTDAEIVINNIPDLSLTPAVPSYLKHISKIMVKKFNAIIEEEVKKYHVILVDLYFQSKIYTKAYPEAISEDKFHPSDFGYALWANTIIAHMQHILFSQKKVK